MALRKHVCLIEFLNVPVFLIKRRTLARDAIFSTIKNLPRRRNLFPYPNFYRIVIFTTTVGYYLTSLHELEIVATSTYNIFTAK